jgi:NADPH:quinone reductase-like Zn-dependent oxidoreductase
MKAVEYTEYGPPEVLRLAEVEKPAPGENEVLVKVHAASVNYGDVLARKFNQVSPGNFTMPLLLWPVVRLTFGWSKPRKRVLGNEFAGEVEAVGASVTRFKVGDPVYGYRGQSMGTYAEYLTMPEDGTLAIKPANTTYEEAAALPYAGIMASNLLRGRVQPGDKVLILGASGGIGSGLVQLAKHSGANVTGVCGTPRLEYVSALGADQVIDYTVEDFTQRGETYDLVIDILGVSSFALVKGILREGGRYLRVSFKMKQLLEMLWTSITGGKKVLCVMSGESPEDLDYVRTLVEAGDMRSIVDRAFPLEETAEAHRYVESGQRKGAVAITVLSEQ